MNRETSIGRLPLERLEDRALLSGAGSLDPSFGTGGIVNTADHPTTVLMRPDGKVLTAGWTSARKSTSLSLARYNSSGQLDPSFGTGGRVSSSALKEVEGAVVYPNQGTALDGKIVAVDFWYNLARFNSNGTLDKSFGSKGVAKPTLPSGTWYPASIDLVLQPDGKIIAGGSISDPSGPGINHTVFALARYNSNGSLDTSFGTGGFVRAIAGPGDSWINDIELQADGRIVVAAGAVHVSGGGLSQSSFVVARFNTNGTLDTSFGPSHTGVAAVGGGEAWGVAIQPDGKIVAAGRKGFSSERFEWMIARFDTSGNLDTSFDSDGTVVPPIPPDSWASNVAVQADGAIVAGGYVGDGMNAGLVRYDTSGQLDPTFGTGGIVITSMGGAGHWTLSIQSDGRIITSGRQLGGDGPTSQYLARYLGSTTVTTAAPAPTSGALVATTSLPLSPSSGDDSAVIAWPEVPSPLQFLGGWRSRKKLGTRLGDTLR